MPTDTLRSLPRGTFGTFVRDLTPPGVQLSVAKLDLRRFTQMSDDELGAIRDRCERIFRRPTGRLGPPSGSRGEPAPALRRAPNPVDPGGAGGYPGKPAKLFHRSTPPVVPQRLIVDRGHRYLILVFIYGAPMMQQHRTAAAIRAGRVIPSSAAAAPWVVRATERDIENNQAAGFASRYLPSRLHSRLVSASGEGPRWPSPEILLSRKPNLYLARPHQQRQCADANYPPSHLPAR